MWKRLFLRKSAKEAFFIQSSLRHRKSLIAMAIEINRMVTVRKNLEKSQEILFIRFINSIIRIATWCEKSHKLHMQDRTGTNPQDLMRKPRKQHQKLGEMTGNDTVTWTSKQKHTHWHDSSTKYKHDGRISSLKQTPRAFNALWKRWNRRVDRLCA